MKVDGAQTCLSQIVGVLPMILESNMDVNEITTIELASEFSKNQNLFLVDVREAVERNISVLPDHLHIPIDELEGRFAEIPRDKDVVIYCRTGARSDVACRMLMVHHFENVRNLVGGINRFSDLVDPTIEKY